MSFKLTWDEKDVIRGAKMEAVAFVRRGAELVKASARANCPTEKVGREASRATQKRVPGSLRDSIRISTFEADDAVGAYVKAGGAGYMSNGVDVYYGIFVALGTPGTTKEIRLKDGSKKIIARTSIDSNPFLQDALRENLARIMAGGK